MSYNPDKFIAALLFLCPGLNTREIVVDDIGGGPFISHWGSHLPRPTQQEIEAVDTDSIYDGPATVTPRQARLALFEAGILDQVQAAVDVAGGATKITWEYATEINRTDPLIVAIGGALGLSSQQIDALFVNASNL